MTFTKNNFTANPLDKGIGLKHFTAGALILSFSLDLFISPTTILETAALLSSFHTLYYLD